MIDISKEIFYLRQPTHVCKCGTFIYSKDDLYMIEHKEKPLNEKFEKVCRLCYLKHKGVKVVDKDGFII